jgi:hypothetical protein
VTKRIKKIANLYLAFQLRKSSRFFVFIVFSGLYFRDFHTSGNFKSLSPLLAEKICNYCFINGGAAKNLKRNIYNLFILIVTTP